MIILRKNVILRRPRSGRLEGRARFIHISRSGGALSAGNPGGEHVAPAMLRLALRGAGQAMLVTDAMPPVGGNGKTFELAGKPVRVADGRCTTADGTLAGSALDMASAVRNCVRLLDMTLPDALRLASAAPAAFLGLDNRLGHIAPGFRADLVALEPAEIRMLATWVAGEESPSSLP